MANETSLSIVELIGAAEALKGNGSFGAAEVLYGTWVAQNPDDPLLYAVLFNQSVLFSETGKLAAARKDRPSADPYPHPGQKLYRRYRPTGAALV